MQDIDDRFFKQMVRESYRDADIYELWNSYILADNHAKKYRKVGWVLDMKDSEIEMAVLIELMRVIPHNKKREFYNELLVDYNYSNVILDDILSFFESIEFFKSEILNRHEN